MEFGRRERNVFMQSVCHNCVWRSVQGECVVIQKVVSNNVVEIGIFLLQAGVDVVALALYFR